MFGVLFADGVEVIDMANSHSWAASAFNFGSH
jgi:hypothetical protein